MESVPEITHIDLVVSRQNREKWLSVRKDQDRLCDLFSGDVNGLCNLLCRKRESMVRTIEVDMVVLKVLIEGIGECHCAPPSKYVGHQ